MNHDEIKELLPLYAMGALDEKENKEIRQYLLAHPELNDELEQYNKTVGSIDSLNLKAPDGILDNIMNEIEKPSMKERVFSFLFPSAPMQGLAYIGLILLLGAYIFIGNPEVTIAMTGTDAAKEATGSLVIKDETTAMLNVEGLKKLDKSKTYQLWLIKDGKRTDGGIFMIAQGNAELKVISPLPFSEYDAFGITIEPAGGSPEPTGIKVMGS